MDIIAQALECASPENPVLFVGAPGIGKTARIEQWALDRDMDLLVEHPTVAQSVDYRGLPAVIDGEAHWLPIGGLKRICAPDCGPTLVLLDDVGQAPAPVQAALMQLIWARKLGDAVVSDNVIFAAATNRVTDRSGVRPMLSALIGRCQVVTVDVDADLWAAWALVQPDIAPEISAYARFRPDCFVSAVPDQPMQPYCTPRSLAAMGRLVMRGVSSLDLLSGWVGMGIAADFAAYSESIAKIPPIEKVLDDPLVIKGIKDPGLMHAIVAQAARRSSDRPDDVINLASTMGGGWGVTLISAATGVDANIKKSDVFKQWAVAHKEVL